MKIQLKEARVEIASSRKELANISNKLTFQRDSARKNVWKNQQMLEAAIVDAVHYEDVLLSENDNISCPLPILLQ